MNDAAARALSNGGPAAEGSIFIAEHHAPAGKALATPVFAMVKMADGYDPDHGDFRYVATDARGATVLSGPERRCSSCHDLFAPARKHALLPPVDDPPSPARSR